MGKKARASASKWPKSLASTTLSQHSAGVNFESNISEKLTLFGNTEIESSPRAAVLVCARECLARNAILFL